MKKNINGTTFADKVIFGDCQEQRGLDKLIHILHKNPNPTGAKQFTGRGFMAQLVFTIFPVLNVTIDCAIIENSLKGKPQLLVRSC